MSQGYSEIGGILRAGRVELGLSALQVSQMMHVRQRYIEALEEGRLGELPGLPYARGYLLSYAALLRLDKDEILRRFEQVENPLTEKSFYIPQALRQEAAPARALAWGSLAFMAGFYLLWLAVSPGREKADIVQPFALRAPAPASWPLGRLREVACVRTPDVLYPPCTGKVPETWSLLPLGGHAVSVLDLPIARRGADELPES